MRLNYTIILPAIIFVACSEPKEQTPALHNVVHIKEPAPNGFCRMQSFGCSYNDTGHFMQINCGLYKNVRGDIALLSKKFFEKDQALHDIFLTTLYNSDTTDSLNGGMKELRDVVDTNSFRELGTFYLRDKNHVYSFNPMSDGGTLSVNWKIDGKTLQLLNDDGFAKDKKHCYYRGTVIKGADQPSFKMLDTAAAPLIAFDKKNYYETGEPLSSAEIRRQRLDSIRKKKYGY